MTMKAIADRLRAEFPNRTMAFRCEIFSHRSGNPSHDLSLYYWDDKDECQSLRCRSLDEGIVAIHGLLSGADIEQEVPTDVMSMEVVA